MKKYKEYAKCLRDTDEVKNIKRGDIRGVELLRGTGGMRLSRNTYIETIKVSKNGVNFKRQYCNQFTDERKTVRWSVTTSSKEHKEQYGNLLDAVMELTKNYRGECVICDVPPTNVVVHLKNNKKVMMTFYHIGLRDIDEMIINFVPKDVHYNDEPDDCCIEKLTKEKLDEIRPVCVDAVMYATKDAKQNPGEVEIVKGWGWLLRANYLKKKCGISLKDVTNKLEGFDQNMVSENTVLAKVMLNNENWVYISLGKGNHLYLSERLFNYIGRSIMDYDEDVRYENWKKYFEKGAEEHKK